MGGAGSEKAERSARLRDRARRAAATAVLAAAVAITAATSYMDAEVTEELTGDPFLLTPETPEVTVPISFAATPEALEGNPEMFLRLSYTVIWSEVEENSAELGVRTTRHTPTGRVSRFEEGYCDSNVCRTTCWRDCIGSYDLVFQWPEHLREGSARVEWSLEALFRWRDDGGFFSPVPEPAEGTALVLESGESTGGAEPPVPVANWETVVEQDVAVVEEAVTVRTREALDGGVLALEALFDPQLLRAALLRGSAADNPPAHLATRSSTPITVPDECHNGPCTFTFDTITQLVAPMMFSDAYRAGHGETVDWAITATSPVDVEVVAERASTTTIAAESHLGRLVLEGADGTDRMNLVVTIPAGALPAEEWPADLDEEASDEDLPPHANPAAGTGPIIMLELRPDIDPEPSGAPWAPDLHLRVIAGLQHPPPHQDENLSANWIERATGPRPWGPWRTPLRNDCLPDEPCRIELEIVASVSHRDPPGRGAALTLELDAEVAVLLPWTDPAPSAAPSIRHVTARP